VSEGRRYKVEGVLGKGGFGTVYKAQLLGEGGFTRSVALKVLNADMEGMEDVARRLRDEARLLGLLRHRAILHVDGLVRIDGRWTVVMEYIHGVDLQGVARGGGCPLGPALEIIGEVASALHIAYTTTAPDGVPLKLLHRDIKPPNILLTGAGEVKVLDFGIARAEFDNREAQTRSVLYGSVGYMAPERLDFQELHEGDVYALGTVLYEILAGSPLGKASIREERHGAAVVEAVDLIERKVGPTPTGFSELLASMLAYDPEDRPSAREVERRCRAIRQQLDGPWLRDWAEKAVPPLIQNRRLGTDDTFSGSVVVESGGVSLLVDEAPAPVVASSTMPVQPAPAPAVAPVRPAPSPPRRRKGSWLKTLVATFGLVGCGVLLAGGLLVGVLVLAVVGVAIEVARDSMDDDVAAVGPAQGATSEVRRAAQAPTAAPSPAASADKPAARAASSDKPAAPPASSDPPGGSGALSAFGPPKNKIYQSALQAPWSGMGLPVEPGVVLFSDATSLVLTYGRGPLPTMAQQWRDAFKKNGWKTEYEMTGEDVCTVTMLRDGRRLALSVTQHMGDVLVSIGVVD